MRLGSRRRCTHDSDWMGPVSSSEVSALSSGSGPGCARLVGRRRFVTVGLVEACPSEACLLGADAGPSSSAEPLWRPPRAGATSPSRDRGGVDAGPRRVRTASTRHLNLARLRTDASLGTRPPGPRVQPGDRLGRGGRDQSEHRLGQTEGPREVGPGRWAPTTSARSPPIPLLGARRMQELRLPARRARRRWAGRRSGCGPSGAWAGHDRER